MRSFVYLEMYINSIEWFAYMNIVKSSAWPQQVRCELTLEQKRKIIMRPLRKKYSCLKSSCDRVNTHAYGDRPNYQSFIITSWHGNALLIVGTLWEESTGHRWNFPHKGSVTWSSDISFDASLNKLLNKHTRDGWIEKTGCSLDVIVMWKVIRQYRCYVDCPISKQWNDLFQILTLRYFK